MENQEFQIKRKHELSLVCNFLFPIAPLIYIFTDKMGFDLNDDEKKFINGYKKLGTINLFILILNTLIWFVYYMFWQNNILYRLGKISITAIVVIIIAGIWMIFSDRYIFTSSSDIEYEYKKIGSGNINILLYYIPVYNFYIRYTQEKNIKSYRWLKESILFWTFFSLIGILGGIDQNVTTLIILILFLIFRIFSLLGGIDIIQDKHKERLDNIFEKNPEEIFGYIKGSIIYLFKKIISKNIEGFESSIHQFINNEKKSYSYIINNWDRQIIIEYLSFIILFGGWIWYSNFLVLIRLEIYSFILIIPWIIIIGRYLISIINKKLVYIPIIHEIVIGIRKIINL